MNIGVHRLVGLHFIPNPENKPTVNHKVADKSLNCVDNLEWATHKEQSQHVRKYRLNPTTTPCCIVDSNDNIINIYNSCNEAMEFLKFNTIGDITRSCKGVINTVFGMRFRYYNFDTCQYTFTKWDLDKTLKPKGKYKKQIYCTTNGKTYNTQMECSDDLQTIQSSVSKILRGEKENTLGIFYVGEE